MTTKPQTELMVKGNFDLSAPSQMADMAKVLKKHIVTQGLSTVIVGKQYVQTEGWQFAGGLMGMAAKIVKVENLSAGNEKKWRADVEIVRLKDNVSVGFGTAICSNLESKKRSFDEYAICSMAQTRAIGKAYRNMIGWVIKLAGYESTPSEEMMKMGVTPTTVPAKPAPVIKPTVAAKNLYKEALKKVTPNLECNNCGAIIDSKVADYSKKMYGKRLCRDCQKEVKK